MMHEPAQSWLHEYDCRCDSCEPYAPSEPEQLTAAHLAMLAFTGFMGAAGLSALLNPHATLVSLAAIVGVGL
ncbi:hypothetical protein GCM10022268_17070 [Sphingomonas cynarae]|uniref:Uncharacterized protein n=1 Tax=Sphingomonas cynarae TaxID=930197 RepID=A0ABP7DPC5_9SPHN